MSDSNRNQHNQAATANVRFSYPSSTMTLKMAIENEAKEASSPSDATTATANVEGSNSARRPTTLMPPSTLNTPTLNSAPSFPNIITMHEDTPTLVITPNTLNSLLDISGFTPTSNVAPTTFVEVASPQNEPLTTQFTDVSTISNDFQHSYDQPTDLSLSQRNIAHEDTSKDKYYVSRTASKRVSEALDIEEELAMDPALTEAAVNALTTGTLTPLVKEELKYSIQTKRLRIGKDELQVEYKDPEPEKLSAEEEEKRKRRRERNRLAAQKCRNKRRSKMSSLEEESKQLSTDNSRLKKQIRMLELEKQKLSLVMRCHDISDACPSQMKFSTSEDDILMKDIPSVPSSEQTTSVFGAESDTESDDDFDSYGAMDTQCENSSMGGSSTSYR